MTMKTYPEMNAKIVEILRIASDDPALLYVAQRIKELEQANIVRNECLKVAIEALYWYGHNCPVLLCGKAGKALDDIECRLAELEPKKETG